MKVGGKRIMRLMIMMILVIILVGLSGFYILNYNGSLTVLSYNNNNDFRFSSQYNAINGGEKLVGEFQAKENYLGIVSLRISSIKKSNFNSEDKVNFRIKEKGAVRWYSENIYSTKFFDSQTLFPFGFPQIASSQNKVYTFEIESVSRKGNNRFIINNHYPVFVTKYQFPKELLTANRKVAVSFLYNKILYSLKNPDVIAMVMFDILVLIFYLLWIFGFITKQFQPLIKLAHKYRLGIIYDNIYTQDRFLLLLFMLVLIFYIFFISIASDIIDGTIMGIWLLLIVVNKLSSQYSFVFSLFVFVLSLILLLFRQEIFAERAGVLVYYFLYSGTISLLIETIKMSKISSYINKLGKNVFLYRRQLFTWLCLMMLLALIFISWFLSPSISSGDLSAFSPSSFTDYFIYPYAWDWHIFGGFASPFAWLYMNLAIPINIGNILHLSWDSIVRIFYLFPFLLLTLFSSSYLYKKLFPDSQFSLFASFIYLLNTYVFMMVGGGQIVGISLAYAIFPLVLSFFITLINMQDNMRQMNYSLATGLLFALLIFFDLRFAYMLALTVCLYYLFTFRYNSKNVIAIFIIPFGLAGLLHAFWILPIIITHQNPTLDLSVAYTSLQSVKFFSFAKLENAIGLLHPNWPENIFGKVSFMRWEFLFLPLIAYSSLIFLNTNLTKKKSIMQIKTKKLSQEIIIGQFDKKIILFFAMLGLFGTFLAKGANDPFGFIYLWMFQYIPGFIMFRDPTKWYTLIALSYSVLIPFVLWKIHSLLKKKLHLIKLKYLANIFILVVIVYLLFLIRPALLGQIGGTFKISSIPLEYVAFANYLSNQKQYYRTLWLPLTHRFSYSSANHPSLSAQDLLGIADEKEIIRKLKRPETKKLLEEAGVKYVVIPTDPQGEIFLENSQYSERKHRKIITDMSAIPWLKQISHFGDLVVFELSNSRDHFWSPSKKIKISYKYNNPVTYDISVADAKKGDQLVFSEKYDTHWIAKGVVYSSSYLVGSTKFDERFNSFILPESGNYNLKIYYTSQKWVDIGVFISAITGLLVIGSLIRLRLKKIGGKK
jgi:hypothetical protein